MKNSPRRDKRIPLSNQILIGLVLGVLSGLFFGEKAAVLAIVGRAFIGLIQMSILPYMVVSLMLGIGSLSYEKAARLAVSGGIVLVGSWVIAFGVVFLMPSAFPEMQAGTFFSASLLETREVDFIDLYIPVNPFSSLARTVVPAAAVFSVAFGVALIGVEGKRDLLGVLNAISKTLTRIAAMVVKVTPIGVFAIAANAAGTMTLAEFGRLQSYIIPFIGATLVLTFWVLPGLAAALTPFGYRDILHSCRGALITGFVTGNLFVTLTMLVDSAKALFDARGIRNEDNDSYVEVLIPTSFNFPNIGKLLTLLFVLFAGWFVGKEIPMTRYPEFSVLGLFTLFGGVDLALPFLLDQMQIPSDMYQLYVVTGVVNSWFATLLAVMNLYAFTLVAACAVTGRIKVHWPRLLTFLVVSCGVLAGAVLGIRSLLNHMVDDADFQRETLMQSEIERPLHPLSVADSPQKALGGKGHLHTIVDRGTLRVGFNPENLPFSFTNDQNELVGYDVELMHEMAGDLGVTPTFVPLSYGMTVEDIEGKNLDVIIGGLIVTPERIRWMDFSIPYIDMTNAIVALDHRRREFDNWRTIDEESILRLGVVGEIRARELQGLLPHTDVVLLDAYSTFFEGNPQNVDGLVISAEAGSAWTILHPSYSVIVPEPQIKSHGALAIPPEDPAFAGFIDDWLRHRQTAGLTDRLYEKWILGKETTLRKPRWSIGHDVLGWWE